MPAPALPRDTRILVVDDSPAVRARMEAYLRRLGYTEVRSAANVGDGLAAFRETRPQVVFLDLVIEHERGLDFAAPALEEAPLTDIIVMSALPSEDAQVTAAIAEGARDLLSKPVTLPAVERVLSRLASDHHDPTAAPPPTAPSPHDASYS